MRRIGAMTFPRAAIALAMAGPVAWAVWASFQPVENLFTLELPGLPNKASRDQGLLANYERVLTELPLARFLGNSIILTVTASLGTVFTSSLAGFGLSRFEWRGRRLCLGLVMGTMMIPAQVLLIPQFVFFQKLGWVNSYRPLIVPAWLGGTAFFILLFYLFFRSIPRSYEDAARLDGASSWQVYRHVMLPMARPVVGAAIALSAVYHWHEFLAPLVYLSDYRDYPVSVGLRMFHSLQASRPELIMAASVVSLIPPLLIVAATQRGLMRGLSGRREKG